MCATAGFCAADERLLPVGYLPLSEPGRAAEELDVTVQVQAEHKL